MMIPKKGPRNGAKSVLTIVTVLAVVALAGCKSIGPSKLVNTHQGYNDAVQLAETREMLENIVRLRFGDPLQFLGVTQINAQFSVSVGATGGAGNIGGSGGAVGSASGNVGYSDSPTLTFTPRGDDQFIRDLQLPVHLYEAMTFTNRGGVYDGAVFALITSGVNDAPDVPGPNGNLALCSEVDNTDRRGRDLVVRPRLGHQERASVGRCRAHDRPRRPWQGADGI